MRQGTILRTFGLLMVVAIMAPATVQAQTAADIVGEWEFKMDMQGREIVSAAVFSLKPDGTLAGKWTSSGMGARGGQMESELANIKFTGGKLTFDRTISFGDQEFTMSYAGTLQEGKIVGGFSTQMGEMPAVGTRKAPPVNIVGEWEFVMQFGRGGQRGGQRAQQRPPNKIVFTKNADGTYAGKWEGGMRGGQRGGQRMGQRAGMVGTELSDIKLDENKLTFVRKMQMQDRDFSITFTGTVEGDTIKGNMSMAMMGQGQEMPTTLTRVKPLAVLGDWEITMAFGEREFTSTLSFVETGGALAGKWISQMGESELSEVKFENGVLTFKQTRSRGGEEMTSTFNGKIDGDTLTGTMSFGQGEMEIKGKRKGAPAAAAAAAVEPPPITAMVGTWELTTESQRGARTNNLVIKADGTGTYTMRNNEVAVQDFQIEGNQISFKIVQSRGGQEFTREFKGTLTGETLTGEFTTGRGAQKVTGKKIK